MKMLRDDLELRRKQEIHEIEVCVQGDLWGLRARQVNGVDAAGSGWQRAQIAGRLPIQSHC